MVNDYTRKNLLTRALFDLSWPLTLRPYLILWKSFDWIRFYTKKYIASQNVAFKKICDLIWPSMTCEVILYSMKNLCLQNVSIHRVFFYQNYIITEYARKSSVKKYERTDVKRFSVWCNRYYVLKKKIYCLSFNYKTVASYKTLQF